MTAYNRQQFIAEAIESVLASTYPHFELIIVDDCSEDKTVEIAKQYEKADKRIRVFVNEKNLGQFANRNKAATYATGKYLKYLDSDDKLLDFGLGYCVEAMEKEKDAGMGLYLDKTAPGALPEYSVPGQSVYEHFFKRYHLFSGPTGTIIRRDKFEEIGGFDTRFGVPSDVFFNIKFAARYPVLLLPDLFVYYRRHSDQEINNYNDYMVYGYLYFKELLINEHLPLTQEQVAYLYKKMNKRHAITVIRYLYRTRNWREVNSIMKRTGFSYGKIFLSLFN